MEILRKKHFSLLDSLTVNIFSDFFKQTYRTEKRFFVRDRLFTFSTLILMQLNFISRSISVEVSKFLSKFHFSRKEKDGSKQAFSKARQHIKWEGFVYLNDELVKEYYADHQYLHFKDKYLVLATDGTTYELPYEQALLEEFQQWDNGQGQPICMAQGIKLFDVLNRLNIMSLFEPYHGGQGKGVSEQAGFRKCLEKLPQLIDNQKHAMLMLGDMYYPSFYHFVELPRLGYHYVFRVKPTHCLEMVEFVESGLEDSWLTIDLNEGKRKYRSPLKSIENLPGIVKVRCVKIALADGEVEYLLTDLGQEELDRQELGQIYNMRWNEETSFDIDKNKMEVENVSSKTPNGVRQDFYAKILSANITQLLIMDAQQQLEIEQASKNNKYTYQINCAVATGLVKDELPKLLLGYESTEIWYARMVEKILKRREPIRLHRKYPKKRKHKLKYPISKRRVL